MLSGSGNTGSRGLVLGASATAAGIAELPNTGGRNWLMFTSAAILFIGIVMLAFKLVAVITQRL